MNTQQDLTRIALQEQRLRFERFDARTAWEIGGRLKALAEAKSLSVTIDIQLHTQPLYFYAMPGTTPDNVDWVRRKRNAVMRFQRSSYALGLDIGEAKLEATWGLSTRDYALHGGCFPVFVGDACIGTITVSGLPQREDHKLVVEVLAEYLGLGMEGLRLD
jgi:uncharacterized protein (UPF0303 family)